ncbi:hypothetical protein [Planktothrix tepida]|uniref:Uncharacterized protein n=1 Tax=Planktothrix tepida PCC 9214 TaxID=671072 RepID=A0A1J1LEL3_9CYAN|nr:hypothetical protein [Planktothrix tepida]CUR30997.1 conserved hypothetical protein [Planktothrix tepida PCC 9214]
MNQRSIPEKLPFLERLCWQRIGIENLTPLEMLKRYERGWHYRDIFGEINPTEAEFIQQLAQQYGSWLFNQMFTKLLLFSINLILISYKTVTLILAEEHSSV